VTGARFPDEEHEPRPDDLPSVDDLVDEEPHASLHSIDALGLTVLGIGLVVIVVALVLALL